MKKKVQRKQNNKNKKVRQVSCYLLLLVILFTAVSIWTINFRNVLTVQAESETAGIPQSTFAPWCSALYGLIAKELGQVPAGNSVPDIDNSGISDASDLSAFASWYGSNDDEHCYQQFDNDGRLQFDCSDYLQIDWCNGLKQGLVDSLGAVSGDGKYWSTYDLTRDGYIDASDLSFVAMYIGQDNQQACFDRFPFKLNCSQCGNEIVESGEECDWSPPQGCVTTGGYNGRQDCNMPFNPLSPTPILNGGGQPYCTWLPCVSKEYCGDYTVNGPEQCDDGPQGSELCTSDCQRIPSEAKVTTSNTHQTAGSAASATLLISSPETANSAEPVVSPAPDVLGFKIGEKATVENQNWRNIGSQWWDQDVAGQTVFPDGSLLRAWSPAVYHLANGKARHVPSLSELIHSFFGQRIYNVQDWVLDLYR